MRRTTRVTRWSRPQQPCYRRTARQFYRGLGNFHWSVPPPVTGKATEALGSITTALQIAGTMGTYWFEAELHRVKGELLLALDKANAAEAQNCFERALAVARKQNAKSLELRAYVSIVRLAARLKESGSIDRAGKNRPSFSTRTASQLGFDQPTESGRTWLKHPAGVRRTRRGPCLEPVRYSVG